MRHIRSESEHGEHSSPLGNAHLALNNDSRAKQGHSSTRTQKSTRTQVNTKTTEVEPVSFHYRQPNPLPAEPVEPQEQTVTADSPYDYAQGDYTQGDYAQGVNVMLTLERLPSAALIGQNRGDRYRLLMEHAKQQRAAIQRWVQEEGLCHEIMRIGEANSFHLLFLYCTPTAASKLPHAPGVIDVAVSSSDQAPQS